jgi:hypothetical protein
MVGTETEREPVAIAAVVSRRMEDRLSGSVIVCAYQQMARTQIVEFQQPDPQAGELSKGHVGGASRTNQQHTSCGQ